MKKSLKKIAIIQDNRPSWDEYFMEIARTVSTRSTCLRRKVGAIIVKEKRILTTGYNGSPAGTLHCLDIGCLREQLRIPSGERHELCRGLHAEQNALLQAAIHGVSVKDSMVYATSQPCSLCAKMLINAGITRIVYEGDYPDGLALSLLHEAGICLEKFNQKKTKLK
ncbi:MAG: cytidine/deoxycytidylate deaminase family protein [Candidatus Sumerlaeia bacterium]|nr:cytidine/deoxycytidylate deaminase family protein [Candidatus Sumerlaeia bacterium]